ncbi:hypothetical protein FRC02_000740 [Tulasnella sp. 418]|nr:hypothetical protein FRC02_000740 [Tulasnella sp. 418]
MLGDWKTWLEKRKGEPFRPSVVITDNDTKERGALLAIFPQIILLLCKFHTRQCWTNRRNSLVVNVSGSNFVKQQTKTRLQILETSLIESTEFGIAVALVEAEELFCETLSQYLETQACGQAALQYLQYLKQYWLFPELWASWSKAGRVRAGEVMNCRIEGVLPTTNHLESFNRILKQDYIKRFQKGGKRLRFDIFLYYLILRIIPSIFDCFQSYEEHLSWIASRFDGQTFQQRSSGSSRISAHPIAWIPKSNDSRGQARDSSRKKEGEDIAQLNRVHGLKYVDHETLQSRCLSSKTTSFGSNIVEYRLQLHLSGFGWCTCPDFRYHSYREGACKHLYGLLAHLSRLRQSFPTSYLPIFFFPEDREHAIQLYQQHVSSLPKDWLPSTSLLSAVSTLSDLITIPDIGMVEKLDADEDQGSSNDSSDCMTGVQDTTASGASLPGDKLVQVANEEINEADTTFNSILYASGSQGLEDQLRVQLHHHARLLIPQIYNMNLLVNDTRIGTSDELILELSSLVSQLNSSLQTLLQPLPPNAEGSQRGDLATECLPSENQNDISMLMGSAASASAVPLSMLRAPSPEARQKGKEDPPEEEMGAGTPIINPKLVAKSPYHSSLLVHFIPTRVGPILPTTHLSLFTSFQPELVPFFLPLISSFIPTRVDPILPTTHLFLFTSFQPELVPFFLPLISSCSLHSNPSWSHSSYHSSLLVHFIPTQVGPILPTTHLFLFTSLQPDSSLSRSHSSYHSFPLVQVTKTSVPFFLPHISYSHHSPHPTGSVKGSMVGGTPNFSDTPNCGQSFPIDELEEHMHIEFLDPRWKTQRDALEAHRGTDNEQQLGATSLPSNNLLVSLEIKNFLMR